MLSELSITFFREISLPYAEFDNLVLHDTLMPVLVATMTNCMSSKITELDFMLKNFSAPSSLAKPAFGNYNH